MNKWNLCGWAAFGTVKCGCFLQNWQPISCGHWGFCGDVDAKALCAARSQSCNGIMYKVRTLCVKHPHRPSMSSFPFYINLLHQECLWNKLMITPAWNECGAAWKRVDSRGVELPWFVWFWMALQDFFFFADITHLSLGLFFFFFCIVRNGQN